MRAAARRRPTLPSGDGLPDGPGLTADRKQSYLFDNAGAETGDRLSGWSQVGAARWSP
jgi:hypothetical protein